MRIAMRAGLASIAIVAIGSSAIAGEASDAPAPADQNGSAQAQVWFERALSLDIGAGGAPDAVRAFTVMRRAAELGHTQAEFNVAAMLDSGRGAPRDVAQAAVWYARAAAGGNHRAAFNLGQLYESGEGVPVNVDLSRAWYSASELPAAREHLAETKATAGRPALVQAPEPLFPLKTSSLEPGVQQVDLVWTASLEPEAVRYFVELRVLDARVSHEAWGGFVDVSSLCLPGPTWGSVFGLAPQRRGQGLGELCRLRLVGVHCPAVVEACNSVDSDCRPGR
jgi:Sel1 repeat